MMVGNIISIQQEALGDQVFVVLAPQDWGKHRDTGIKCFLPGKMLSPLVLY